MIFTTINSELTGLTNNVTLFGKSFNDIFRDFKSGQGLKTSLFSKAVTENDVSCITNFMNQIKTGVPTGQAWAATMKSASVAGKQMAVQVKSGAVSLKTMTTSANTSKIALVGLRVATVALNMALTTLAAAAIQAIITGLDKLVHSARNASQSADELKAKSMEEAQAAKEEAQSLNELIAKYKELANSDTRDVGTRTEIANVQSQIVDLVGQQASSLDLVNGKLDEELQKLLQIQQQEASNAVDKATTAYHDAKDSHNKAIGEDSFLMFDGYAYVSDDWWGNENAVIDILKNNGFGRNVQKGGLFNSHTFITDTMDENMNMLEGATQKAEFLRRMMATIEDNFPDFASSDIWNKLSTQAQTYEKYAEDVKKAAQNLADSEITLATSDESLSKMSVDSLQNYSDYRDKLIELVKNAPNLSEAIASGDLTNEDIASGVDNYLATLPEFSDYYNQFMDAKEWQKKISDVKKVVTDSDWIQDASWGIAQQRIGEFNTWFDNLSDEDKEIVYEIACTTDTAQYNLEDWQNALENYDVVATQTAEDVKNSLTSAMEVSNALASSISSVQGVLSSQASGKSISIADFSSEELADYRSALEYTNGTMQLNADKVNEIIKAKTEEQIAINNTNKAMAQSEYLENARKIEQYRQQLREMGSADSTVRSNIEASIDSLLAENSVLADTCAQYDLLSSALQEATGAYQHWLNAQSASDYGDMENDAVSAIQRIKDTYDSTSDIYGNYGSKKFDAAVDFIIPESVDPEDLSAIEAYMADFNKYLNFDNSGKATGLNIDKFLSDSVEAGLMSYSEDDGFKILGGKKMEDFAEGLNLSSGVVQAFFDELQLKGGKFDWGDEVTKTIGDLAIEANEAAEALRQVEGNSDLKIKMDVSDLETPEEQIKALGETIQEMNKVKAKPDVDASEVEDANAVIRYCLTQKQLLSQPEIMRVDTSQVDSEISNAIALLQRFQNAQNNLEIQTAVGADTTEAQAEVNSLAGEIANLNPEIKAKLGLDTTSVSSIQSSINGLTTDLIIKAGIDASAITGYNPESKSCDVIYNPNTDLLPQSFDSINRTVNYVAKTSGLPKSFSTITRYVNYVATGDTKGKSNSSGKKSGSHGVNGTAHASGTAKIGGDWGTAPGGKTLVGELGREIVVDPHTGKWYTVGDNGAEFKDIPAGAIVFNHIQTEHLLKNGYVSGRASALVSGTAMITGGYNPYKPISTGGNTSSGGNGSSSSSKSSGKSSSSSSSSSDEDEPQKIDWIEMAIDRIERAINRLKNTAESAYKSLKTKLGAAADEISKVNEEIDLQTKAYGRYLQEAEAVGLSPELAEKVRNGTIDITEYDSETSDLITEYQEWYEKALNCGDAIDELHESLASLYEDRFNNVQEDFENQLSLLEHLTNTYDTGIDALEAKGYLQSTKYYAALQDVEKQNISVLEKELKDLTTYFSEAMASGEIEEGSEAWYEMQQSINDVKDSIAEANVQLLEYAKTMREIEWSYFDYTQDRINQITQEADFLIDLMSGKKLYQDNGQFSDEGLATVGLHTQNYNVYMAQADKYAEEILKIDKEIANDPYNTELIERREELLGLQQDSILAAEEEKQAIVDMVEEGIQIELDALRELIDTYKESLDSAKNLYDYQKKIADKTSDIASLQKQLAAYENDVSEETQAKIQQLKVDLSEAQEDLEETEYEKFISDSKAMLDELYIEYEEILNERLDDVDALLLDIINMVNENAHIISDSMSGNTNSISATLENVANEVGYTMTDSMREIWNSANAVVSAYGNDFTSRLTSINAVLNQIQANTALMAQKSNEEATSTVTQTTPTTTPTQTTPPKPVIPPIQKPIENNTGNKPPEPTKTISVGGTINASGAPIYSYAGDTRGQHQYFASDPIYTVLKEQNGYLLVRHHNLSSGYTGWFRKSDVKAYKTGGLVDYTGLAQLDGTPGKPELVLSAEDTENFLSLRDTLRTLSQQEFGIKNPVYNVGATDLSGLTDISGILTNLNKPYITTNATGGDVNIEINIDHVQDYNDFVTQLQKDKQFERMIRSMSTDQLFGGSSLAKNKYHWNNK